MKTPKYLSALFFSFCLVVLFTFPVFAYNVLCTETVSNKGSQHSLQNLTDDELKHYLEDHNKLPEIIEKNGIYFRFTINFLEKYDFDYTVGPNGYCSSSVPDGTCYVEDSGIRYGYMWYFPNKKIVSIFDDELRQYSIDQQPIRSNLFNYLYDDEIISRNEYNGILRITLKHPFREDEALPYEQSNVEIPDKVDYIIEYVTADLETGLLLSVDKDLVIDGIVSPMSTSKYCYYDHPVLATKTIGLIDKIMPEQNSHRIQVIVGQGTEREKKYIASGSEDAFLDLWVRDINQNYNCYLDPEYKIPCPTDEDGLIAFDCDKTLYMK